MEYTFKDFSREFGQPIFNLGLGALLLQAESMHTWFAWVLTAFIVIFGLVAIVQFGAIANFWKHALLNREHVRPGGKAHDGAQRMFDHTCIAVVSYRFKETFWFNVASSMVLLAGLHNHGLMIAFAVEAISCVVVFSVTRSFLTHFAMYYKLVEGKELEDV